jgi:thiol-disulfide isomerase/thioredoxin
MFNSRRVFAVTGLAVALAASWMAFGPGEAQKAEAQQAGGGQDVKDNLNQAAASVVAAAELSVHAARGEDEILQRLDYSIEALRILGVLGATDTGAQSEKLLDDVQAKVSPAAAEVVIRMRLARQLQHWSKLSKTEHEKALNRFVSDVQSEGLTPGHADLLLRLTDNLEMGNQGALAANAIKKLLPAFENSSEPSLQRRTPVLQGIVHRLELVGKPFELEGTLLDGAEFDWGQYRGKVVLVDFFANWCGICREEVPIILQAHRAYRNKGFEVVGVSVDKHPQLAEAYRQETGFGFPTLFSKDPRAMEWKSPMAVKYGVTSLPRAILVDQKGNVVETVARGERLIEHLRELLGPPGAPLGLGGLGEIDGVPTDDGSSEPSDVVPAAFEETADAPTDASEATAPAVPEN